MINGCKNYETTPIETNYKLNQINEWIIYRIYIYIWMWKAKKKHAKHECTWYDSK
jgi:hypothetical protein